MRNVLIAQQMSAHYMIRITDCCEMRAVRCVMILGCAAFEALCMMSVIGILRQLTFDACNRPAPRQSLTRF
jgi:hypothetical protein